MSDPAGPRGILFVLSAPSGAGKDTILSAFLERGMGVEKCVTATTRGMRPGEIPGRDYHFWSEAEFARRESAGELLEAATVHGHRYGTPRRWVEEHLAQGQDVILKIDVQGGLAVKQLYPDAVLIFVAPPSLAVMEERLRRRQSENEAQIRRRLQDAPIELAHRHLYDYIIVNDVLEDAVDKLAAIVTAERCRASRYPGDGVDRDALPRPERRGSHAGTASEASGRGRGGAARERGGDRRPEEAARPSEQPV